MTFRENQSCCLKAELIHMNSAMRKASVLLVFLMGTILLPAMAPNDIRFRQLSDERIALQSRFAKAQQALGMDPSKAPAEAQIEMESFGKALTNLKTDLLLLLNERYTFWNNQNYWNIYWEKGPSAKFVVAKLRAQIDAATILKLPMDAPFNKVDLNTFQKQLDAIRNCLELDRQLQQMESLLKNLPKR